jgi:hypothetical protein
LLVCDIHNILEKVLQAYDGRHLAYNITSEQFKKLSLGQPVILLIFFFDSNQILFSNEGAHK